MGPFIFQLVDETALPFNAAAHAIRNDADVFAFDMTHAEGDFATLELQIQNPREGLLNPDRDQWAWLSVDRAWVPDLSHTPDIRPLFYGRIVGIPENLHAEVVVVNFIARPVDFVEQKEALAATLKVRPYWDPIWFSPEQLHDPDNVLESRPELWHIDPVTHVVSTSHVLTGEDGTESLDETEVFYDSLSISFGSTPLRRVEVTAGVSWDQYAFGEIDLRNTLGNSILSYTGISLIENWPKPGTSLGGGYIVVQGGAERIDTTAKAVYGYFNYGLFENSHAVQVPEWAGAFLFKAGGNQYQSPPHLLVLPQVRVRPTLVVGYDATRQRNEGLTFVLEAGVQSIMTEPGDEEVLQLSFSSSEIVTPLDEADDGSEGFRPPIRDLRARSYFATDRGAVSLEYLIALARARLLARARAVEVEFEIDFNQAVDLELSCRKNVNLSDYRLPGGSCAGKIIEYRLSCDGDTGALSCHIRIGCSIGLGATVSAVDGDPLYVEIGYVDPGYQQTENAFVMPIAGEVTYGEINGLPPDDDGIEFRNLTMADIVIDYQVTGTPAEQEAAMGTTAGTTQEVFERLNAAATEVILTLRPLTGGPFTTNYAVPTSLLSVPKTIDLEAEYVS